MELPGPSQMCHHPDTQICWPTQELLEGGTEVSLFALMVKSLDVGDQMQSLPLSLLWGSGNEAGRPQFPVTSIHLQATRAPPGFTLLAQTLEEQETFFSFRKIPRILAVLSLDLGTKTKYLFLLYHTQIFFFLLPFESFDSLYFYTFVYFICCNFFYIKLLMGFLNFSNEFYCEFVPSW